MSEPIMWSKYSRLKCLNFNIFTFSHHSMAHLGVHTYYAKCGDFGILCWHYMSSMSGECSYDCGGKCTNIL